MAKQRLHKFLASAGVASRRESEKLIEQGRVSVDGVRVREMGVIVDPDVQEVRFDGDLVRPERPVYYIVNKPAGFLSTTRDEFGRPTVISLVEDRGQRRLYTVGRLDEDSEGLILVTNDGMFANRMMHSRYGIDRTYEIKLAGYLDNDALAKAREGVWLPEGKSPPLYVRVLRRSERVSAVKVVIREGKNRDLRRIFSRLGHNVTRLVRTAIGDIGLSGLHKGQSRLLSKREVEGLLARCDAPPQPRERPDRPVHAGRKPASRRGPGTRRPAERPASAGARSRKTKRRT